MVFGEYQEATATQQVCLSHAWSFDKYHSPWDKHWCPFACYTKTNLILPIVEFLNNLDAP